MNLISIVFRERPGYRRQYVRPYVADATGDLVDELARSTRDLTEIGPGDVSGVAGRIIRPRSRVSDADAVDIAGGWEEPRLMFIMTVETRSSTAQREIVEISGCTDYVGVSEGIRGVHLDPKMCLYFNSINTIQTSLIETPTRGRSWISRTSGSHNLLSRYTFPDFSRRNQADMMTQRPVDIFQAPVRDVVARATNRHISDNTEYRDARFSLAAGERVRPSERLNDSPCRFLSRSLSKLREAYNTTLATDEYSDVDPSRVLAGARASVRERSLMSFLPIHSISSETNYLENGFIHLSELMDLNPDFDWDGVKVFRIPPAARGSSVFSDSSDWNGGDNTSISAVQLVRALPAYMTHHNIASCTFEADNQEFGGEITVLTSECTPTMGRSMDRSTLAAFEKRLIEEVLPDILPWDGCPFNLRVDANSSSDIVVEIQVANETPGRFVFPVFCANMVAPVLTTSYDDIMGMGSTLSTIVEMAGDSVDNSGSSGILVPDTFSSRSLY